MRFAFFCAMCLGALVSFAKDLETHSLTPLIASENISNSGDVGVINDMFLQNTQAQNLKEIFAKNADTQVGGGAQIAQKLYVRNIEDRMFRTHIDGIAQGGNLFHHQGNMQLSPFLIKSIEIQKGLADVEYGAGALFGGINITTKNAFDMLKNNNYGALVSLGAQSNRGINTAVAAYGKIIENLGLLASYDFDDTPYYRDGDGRKVLTSPSQSHNALFKLTYMPKSGHSLNLNYHFNHLDSIAPFAANVLTASNPTLFDNALNAHNAGLKYDYASEDFAFFINSYYAHKSLSLSPRTTLQAVHEEESAMDLSLAHLGSDVMFKHYFGEARHNIKYGLNYQLISTKAHNLTQEQLAHNNRGYEQGAVYGGFIGAEFYLLDSIMFALGSRYDTFSYKDKFALKHNTSGFSPYAILQYTPFANMSFKLKYNYNTRGAMPQDISLLSNAHALIRPLRAENLHNAEFNIDYDNSVFSTHLGLYHQQLKHFINSYANSGAAHEHNHAGEHTHEDMYRQNTPDSIKIIGYEASAGLDFDMITFHMGIAQSFPTFKQRLITDTFELAAVSGRSYSASVGLRPFSAAPQFEILYLARFIESINYQGYNLYYNDLDSVHKGAYNTHNLYLSYLFKHAQLKVAFLNLTNQTYISATSPLKELFAKESGVGIYEPGFSAKVQVAFWF